MGVTSKLKLCFFIVLAIDLSGCQRVNFRTTAENAVLKGGVLDDEDDENTDDQDPPAGGLSTVKTRSMCMSSSGVLMTQTSVIHATDGITFSLYRASPNGRVEVSIANRAFHIDDPLKIKKIREDLINERQLKIDLSTVADGDYAIRLCDVKKLGGPQCPGTPSGPLPTNITVFRRYGIIGPIFPADRTDYYVRMKSGKIYDVALNQTMLNKPNRLPQTDVAMNVLYGQNNTVRGAEDITSDIFDSSECDEKHSPLIIDMADIGISLSKPTEGVQFDIIGNGKKQQMSWTTDDSSPFLALDVNNNGRIDDIHELFGNNTRGVDGTGAASGFEALKKYDSNLDGVVDRRDPVFAQLLLWVDANRNGESEAGELQSVMSSEIATIDLDYIEMLETDAYGNETRQRSLVRLLDGSIRKIVDIWFRTIY